MCKSSHLVDRDPSANFMSCRPWARYVREHRITYLQKLHTNRGSFFETTTFTVNEPRDAIAHGLRKARRNLKLRAVPVHDLRSPEVVSRHG